MVSSLIGVDYIVRGVRILLGTDKRGALELTVTMAKPIRFWLKGVTKMQMTDIQEVVATVSAVDAEGNPASLSSVPVWSSSNTNIVLVTASPDGMSAVISSPSPGPLGSAVVTVTADVNGTSVSATAAIDIIADNAVGLNLSFGTPTTP